MNKLNEGDIVVLNRKAIDDFYGKEESIEMFSSRGNIEELSAENFLEFVEYYLGFESGERAGYVGSISGDTAKIIFFLPTGRWKFSYYDVENLDVVGNLNE